MTSGVNTVECTRPRWVGARGDLVSDVNNDGRACAPAAPVGVVWRGEEMMGVALLLTWSADVSSGLTGRHKDGGEEWNIRSMGSHCFGCGTGIEQVLILLDMRLWFTINRACDMMGAGSDPRLKNPGPPALDPFLFVPFLFELGGPSS